MLEQDSPNVIRWPVIPRNTCSPLLTLLAAIELAEDRLLSLSMAGADNFKMAGASMEEIGKIILAKREYIESVSS